MEANEIKQNFPHDFQDLPDNDLIGYFFGSRQGDLKNFRISAQKVADSLGIISLGGTPIYFEGDQLPSVNNTDEPVQKGDWVNLTAGQTYLNINGGANIETPIGRWSIGAFDGDKWVLKDMGELPQSLKSVNNSDLNSAIESGIYKVDTGNNSYLMEVSIVGSIVRQFRTNPNHGSDPYITYRDYDTSAETPTWTPWQDARSIINIPVGDLETLTTQGLYKAYSATGSYFVQVQVLGGVTRQFRLNNNLADPGKPAIMMYRDWNGSSWSNWVTQRMLNLANDNYNLITEAGIYYRDQNVRLPMILIVNKSADGQLITQLRMYSSDGSSSLIQDRRSTNGGTSWSDWSNIVSKDTQFDGALSSINNPPTGAGLFKYITSGSGSWVQRAVSGSITREFRIISNVGSQTPPQLIYRDYDSSAETPAWGSWINAFNIIGFSGATTPTGLNSLFSPGVYWVNSTNPYFVNIVVSGGVVRQFRNEPNMAGKPRLVYRDYDTMAETPAWTVWQESTGVSDIKKSDSTSNDMMWSWWNYPLILRTNKPEDYQDNLFISYTDSVGETGVMVKSMKDNSLEKKPIKPEIIDIDDHNAGTITRLSNGLMLSAFSSGHNRSGVFYVYRSKKREAVNEWDQVFRQNLGGTVTYAQTLYINGVIYIFFRHRIAPTWRWSMISSDDNGDTWTPVKQIINSPSLQWYAIFRPVLGNDNLIRIVHYPNATIEENIYGGFIDLVNNTVLDQDGSTVIGDVDDVNIVTDFTPLILLESGFRNRLLDVKITSSISDWKIIYCKFTNQSDGVYRLYNSGNDIEIGTAGVAFFASSRYYSGAVFGEDGVIFAAKRVGGYGILDKFSYNESSVTFSEEISRSLKYKIRPIYDSGVLAWLEGYYNPSDYTDFLTQLVTKEV